MNKETFDSLSEEDKKTITEMCEKNGLDIDNVEFEDSKGIKAFAEKHEKQIAMPVNILLDYYLPRLEMYNVINSTKESFKELINESYNDKMPVTKEEFEKFVVCRAMYSPIWIYFYARNKIVSIEEVQNSNETPIKAVNMLTYRELDEKVEEEFEKIYYDSVELYLENQSKDVKSVMTDFVSKGLETIKRVVEMCKESKSIYINVAGYIITVQFKYMLDNEELEKMSLITQFIKQDYIEYFKTIEEDTKNANIFITLA